MSGVSNGLPATTSLTTEVAESKPINEPVAQSLASSGDAAAVSSAVGQHKTESTVPEATAVLKGQTSSISDAIKELWTDAQKHSHKEIWGVTLADPSTHVPTQVILQKYLNANDGDLTKAKAQLKSTLNWRAQTDPSRLITNDFSKERFSGLGYITSYSSNSSPTASDREVFTWNVYGGPGLDITRSFGDLDAFISWRVALMELAMQELDLNTASTPITAEHDPYKIYQVHDYKGTSFFRSPPQVRVAAKRTIEVLAMAYPETLKEKFFVNVPAIMGFMYGIMKVFVAAKTIKRFHPMSNGVGLVHEFPDSKVKDLGQQLPKEYGGKGEPLKVVGRQTRFE